MKVDRIKDSDRIRYVLPYPPTKLLLDHEPIKTDDLWFIVRDVGVEIAIVWQQASGADAKAFERSLMEILLARRYEPHLVSRVLAGFKKSHRATTCRACVRFGPYGADPEEFHGLGITFVAWERKVAANLRRAG